MFGGKITHQGFNNGLMHLKHRVGTEYQRTKHFLGNVNHAYNTAKKIYSVAGPHIDRLTGSDVNKHVIKAMNGYENLRSKAIAADNTIGKVAQVVNKLGNHKVSIGLG